MKSIIAIIATLFAVSVFAADGAKADVKAEAKKDATPHKSAVHKKDAPKADAKAATK